MISDEWTWLCSNQPKLQNKHWMELTGEPSFADTWPRCLLSFVIDEEPEAYWMEVERFAWSYSASEWKKTDHLSAYSIVIFPPFCFFHSIKEIPKHNLSFPRAFERRKRLSTFYFLFCDLKAKPVLSHLTLELLGDQRAEGMVGVLALGLRDNCPHPSLSFYEL